MFCGKEFNSSSNATFPASTCYLHLHLHHLHLLRNPPVLSDLLSPRQHHHRRHLHHRSEQHVGTLITHYSSGQSSYATSTRVTVAPLHPLSMLLKRGKMEIRGLEIALMGNLPSPPEEHHNHLHTDTQTHTKRPTTQVHIDQE